MANLTESESYDEGVYQLELTDPVQGGANGLSNKPLKNLANRTNWLKKAIDALSQSFANLAPKNSPEFTGTPLTPDVALGDSSGKVANTKFVQGTANGQLVKSVAGGATVTLTAAEAGNAIYQFFGALTANIAVVVPNSSKAFIVDNRTSGAFALTVKTAAGAGVIVMQGRRRELMCDGTNVALSTSDYTGVDLRGATTADSPGALDISRRIATSESVKAAGLQISAKYVLAADVSTTILPSQAGGLFILPGTGLTRAILPDLASVPIGTTFSFFCNSPTATLQAQGTQFFSGAFGNAQNSAVMQSTDALIVASDGISWVPISDSTVNWLVRKFGAGQTSGYQPLPGGLILQWGLVNSGVDGLATVTFPIAFPNTVSMLTGSHLGEGSAIVVTRGGTVTRTQGSLRIRGVDGGTAAWAIYWFAIGY